MAREGGAAARPSGWGARLPRGKRPPLRPRTPPPQRAQRTSYLLPPRAPRGTADLAPQSTGRTHTPRRTGQSPTVAAAASPAAGTLYEGRRTRWRGAGRTRRRSGPCRAARRRPAALPLPRASERRPAPAPSRRVARRRRPRFRLLRRRLLRRPVSAPRRRAAERRLLPAPPARRAGRRRRRSAMARHAPTTTLRSRGTRR
mmetsp:Transcript_42603/g.141733  ORF Transcript_42603/g.141733 Transcript_42603/m.141733 type:complete len:201 (-) Transcript_42603:427-1029(-)